MKWLPAFLLLSSAALGAAAPASFFVDPALQTRIGLDSNPLAVRGPAMAALGGRDTSTTATGLSFGLATLVQPNGNSLKLTYAGETVRFEDVADENYTSHRLGLAAQATLADWKISADASTLFIDGSRDTLPAVAACNANATALWRERREQFQHRAKLVAQHDRGAVRVRVLGTLLDYDYRTRVQAGRVAFANRGDLLGGADLGWKQSPASLWFVGGRIGAQHQDTVPLPGGSFEYSNHYTRLVAGWEGKLGADTTLAFAAGPDFRHYGGNIDPKVFHNRHHTVGWFDATFTTKLSPTLTLTGKSTRWTWLSSTGKSAYIDFASEVSLAWAVDPALTIRVGAKAHQCSYFPAVRNDWECLGTIGATYKISPRWQLTADVLDHRGWNVLPGFSDRDFGRTVLTLGVAVKL